jgi:hypothetical protein
VQHFIFGHEFIVADHEVGFDDKIELSQDVFGPLGPFHIDGSGRMTELNLHTGIIGLHAAEEQAITRRCYRGASLRDFAASSGETGLM